MATATLDEVDTHLRGIISNLYMLIVQAHDYQGQATQQAMGTEIKNLLQNLQSLSQTARRLPTHIPLEIIQYVENSRNPDIYTREFVELVMRYNQQQKGRADAYAQFRDILGEAMMQGIPEIREDTQKVLEASGGRVKH
ncbi:related to Mediator of RNA polymerase II transcription subunit 10 [Ramularia collo-cygni]|uniref:Mediator of RNA polymerase II transcription subunit 10 n=1 Tax=Ramularia collo-cygni TaxID=112498 RepID=A0A2D3UV23_9PEZI|nr:related to Mediator of RNA polymerase II transcription subunit 10 [Ramularia collo-cygni]CZT16850.1 related to Mediator of RNA polymerase II transcription subunit 10 [Ramularia collo-cygni]